MGFLEYNTIAHITEAWMNTLEERLERSGYYKRLKDNERDRGLVDTAKRDLAFSGGGLPAEMLEFQQAVIDETTALAAEYESTVKVVDARNDLEFALLQIHNAAEIAADDLEQANPKKAAELRALFDQVQDDDPK